MFAYGSSANDVIDNSHTVSGNGLIVWWDNTANPGPFTAGATTGLTSDPDAATKTWARSGADSGINYTNGSNIGFIKVDGVTVN